MAKFKGCVLDAFGLGAGVAGTGLVAGGQNTVATRAKFVRATPGTSVISTYLHGTGDIGVRWLPTVTKSGFSWTTSLGTFAARAAPIVGWVMLAADFARFAKCAY